ncbi:MAG: MBL fold metallo-hydrolase [Lachnospiraceae bacterium]
MAELKIGRMVLGNCSTNCYFLYEEGKQDAIVVDPADRGAWIYEKLNANGFQVAAIFLTHGHFDHILGVKELKELSHAKTYMLKEEVPLSSDLHQNLSDMFGRAVTFMPDVEVSDNETITVSGITCKVIATPGHTEGSCCYYFPEAGFLLCGDTIFLESVGRTDFPTGSGSRLLASVKEKIFTLPETTKLYPGHGDFTTVEHEKKFNPFF